MSGLRNFLKMVTAASVLVAGAIGTARAAELVMFESDSCEWCEIWHREIGPVYPKTREAELAPLRRVSIEDRVPDDLADLRAVMFTPTFVLMQDGKEVGRITGYPGESFFWALLAEELGKLDYSPESARACATETKREEQNEEIGGRGAAC